MCRTLAFVAISAVLVQVAITQAIVPLNSILSNQLILNSLSPNLLSLSPNVNCEYETIVQTPVVQTPIVQTPIIQTPVVQAPVVPATTTIIQDSTVANSLANALQLLIVSNLLSNTLPTMGEVVVPVEAPCGLPLAGSYAPLSVAGLNGISYTVL